MKQIICSILVESGEILNKSIEKSAFSSEINIKPIFPSTQQIRIHDVYHIDLPSSKNPPNSVQEKSAIEKKSVENMTGNPVQIIKCEPEFWLDEPDPIQDSWQNEEYPIEQENWENKQEHQALEQECWNIQQEPPVIEQELIPEIIPTQRKKRNSTHTASEAHVKTDIVKDDDWKKELRRNRKRKYKRKKLQSGSKGFKCKVCGRLFSSTFERRDHTNSEHYHLRLECDQCDFSTFYKNILLNHTETVHLGIIHTCDICGDTFGYLSAMKQHKRVRHEKIPYPCSHCGLLFKNPSALRSHKRHH